MGGFPLWLFPIHCPRFIALGLTDLPGSSTISGLNDHEGHSVWEIESSPTLGAFLVRNQGNFQSLECISLQA